MMMMMRLVKMMVTMVVTPDGDAVGGDGIADDVK